MSKFYDILPYTLLHLLSYFVVQKLTTFVGYTPFDFYLINTRMDTDVGKHLLFNQLVETMFFLIIYIQYILKDWTWKEYQNVPNVRYILTLDKVYKTMISISKLLSRSLVLDTSHPLCGLKILNFDKCFSKVLQSFHFILNIPPVLTLLKYIFTRESWNMIL